MRIAMFILICLLALAAPTLATAQPAEATTSGNPITDPGDADDSGMTCCHHG